ncbi:TPA: hypothetical protein QCQ12_003115 [Bacillus cereus biovar anthracis]|nr:hypothetical protein [Bacillus cereus biovar anthracis]
MSNLLMDSNTILLKPMLAVKIGINEAIVVQQVHYWLERSNHNYDGKKWVFNSLDKWCEQFPFWSKRTLERIFKKLEDENILIVGNYNKLSFDRTKWYSINYDYLQSVGMHSDKLTGSHSDKVAESDTDKMTGTIPETTQEITHKTTMCKDAAKADEAIKKRKPKKNTYSEEFEQLWSIYPKKRNKSKAYQRYKEALAKHHPHEVIIYGVESYANECRQKNTGMEYIKMLEGFLNDERYLEYRRMDAKNEKKVEELSLF